MLAFADEEGARFNTPTFGSRALVGRLDVADALAAPTTTASTLADAMRAAGADPAGLADAPAWLPRLRGFLELHIDQTQDLERLGAPAGAVRSLASRMRLALTFAGRADHAGTTRRGRAPRRAGRRGAAHRRRRRARRRRPGLPRHRGAPARRAERVHDRPVRRAAVDRRPHAGSRPQLAAWREALAARAAELAAATGVEIALSTASHTDGVAFDPAVLAALGDLPPLVCFAGHDAGILAQRIPAGMVFVRNATGVSHAPEEHVELDDAAVAAQNLLSALEALA